MSSRPSARRISHSARGGCIGERVVVLARGLQAAEHDVAQALASRRECGHVAALLGQPGEHVVDVADELDLGREERVDLGGLGVEHDDLLVARAGSSAWARARRGRSRSAITTSASSNPAIA